jgi:hypothetical protein
MISLGVHEYYIRILYPIRIAANDERLDNQQERRRRRRKSCQ